MIALLIPFVFTPHGAADQLFDRAPTLAQITLIQVAQPEACDDLEKQLKPDLLRTRTGLILVGCGSANECSGEGIVLRCTNQRSPSNRAFLFSWYGDVLHEGSTMGLDGILKAKAGGAPQLAITVKTPRHTSDSALLKAIRHAVPATPFTAVAESKNKAAVEAVQERWMGAAMSGRVSCQFGRDGRAQHLLRAVVGGRRHQPWLRLTLAGAVSNCALASTTVRFKPKQLEAAALKAMQALVKATRRRTQLPISQSKTAGPPRVPLKAATITIGCQGTDQSLCKRHEVPAQKVHLEAFEMDRTEVTVAAYKACVDRKACEAPFVFNAACNWTRKQAQDHPMNCVTWPQAQAFCKAHDGRLPSEAEWVRAARGSEGRTYPWGEEAPTCERAIIRSDSPGCGLHRTWPVASRKLGATPEGIYDLTGNVSEWVADTYLGNGFAHYGIQKPVAPSDATMKVLRGGSMFRRALDQRAGHRDRQPPGRRGPGLGFRCVR